MEDKRQEQEDCRANPAGLEGKEGPIARGEDAVSAIPACKT